MKLITTKGELALPKDFQFTIEQKSPVFSTEGTQSIPVTLPFSINFAALDHPDRPGRINKYLRKIPAKLESGLYHKSGQLVIDSAKRLDGITGSIMINESDFYAQIKDQTLPEVFAKISRTDISGVDNWYNHIYDCMTGVANDDFTAFPIAVNLRDGRYQLLNGPDTSVSELSVWPLKWKARRIMYEDQAVNVPDGYGITPFLWLWRMLELLFNNFNYTINHNPFKDDDFLKKIVLINNTADSICKGSLNYSDLVPSCSIADFVKWLEAKFCMHLYIYPESKSVDIVPLSNVIESSAQIDISNIIDGREKYTYIDCTELYLKSDTTLDGASPAAETEIALSNKYKEITELNEDAFRRNAWKYNVVFRRSTGTYYEILRRVGDSSIKREKLGSNYFMHTTGRLPEKKYEAVDLMPTMVEVKLGLNGSKELNVVCPFVGDSRHRNTSYKEKTEAAEQKIVLALFAGRSDEDNIIEAKYMLGTTQQYNNLGVEWSMYDLTLKSLYPLFWRSWNKILMNSDMEIDLKANYSIDQLMSLRLDRPILIKGQQCILKGLSYNIGDRLSNNNSQYFPLKSMAPVMTDVSVSFSEQLYRWNYENNAQDVFSEWDTQEWQEYTWEYTGSDSPTQESYEFIPSPTAEQYNSGNVFYHQVNAIRVAATRLGDTSPTYFDRELESWFRPVLIEQ